MRKKIGLALATIFLTFIPVSFATGQTLFSDTFNTLNNVDQSKTTALVDTGNGWVELWHPSQTTAIASDGANGSNLPQDILVADQNGVEWYSYDQSSGKMSKNSTLSMNYTNPVGVSLVPQTNTFYTLVDNGGGNYSIKQAVFDGSAMVDNPNMLVSGLSNVVTITQVSNNAVAEADKQGNISVYTNIGGGVVKDTAHSFSTGLTNIVSVANIPGTWDFMVFTQNNAYRYVYDQGSGGYVKNSAYTINAAGVAVSGDIADSGNLIDLLTSTQNTAYAFDQSTGTVNQSSLFTIGSLTNAVAVKMPNDQSTVIATQDGTIHTYQLTGSSMSENANLQIQGISFTKDYQSPGVYQSTPITPSSQNNMFQLVPTEQNDPGTSITYALSVDGGNTFTAVQPNTWTHLPAGTTNPPAGANVPSGPYVIQATLNSSSPNSTPRITDIVLNGYLDVTPPTAPGQPTANPNPSGQTTTTITWAPSTDPIQAPSTGASGVSDYLIQFSTDGGNTWGSWIDTKSSQPSYVLNVPQNTAVNYLIRVEAMDAAGNISDPSPLGQVFIDTKPLKLDNYLITQINSPGPNQTDPLPTPPPVYVQSGGGATLQVQTEGAAQSVTMQVLGNIPPNLYASNPVSLVPSQPTQTSDINTWTTEYVVPITWADGTPIPNGTALQVTLTITGLDNGAGAQTITKTFTIVITNNSVSQQSQVGTKAYLGYQ